MKIGIIADGQAEAQALDFLLAKLRREGIQFLKPVYADMQPYAPAPQIVRASESRIHLLTQRGADRFIVILDRENNDECPGDFSCRIKREFHRRGHENTSVVLKNRAFENWLIGDPRSLQRGAHRRIVISDRVVQRIEVSGADSLNAVAVLDGCIDDGYNKRTDAIDICKLIDPDVIQRHSRSFRKFVKEIG